MFAEYGTIVQLKKKKNAKNTHDGVFLKVTLFYKSFSRFKNCTDGTKSGKASLL